MTEIVELECPGCGRPLTTDVKECPACHRPVVITSFNSVYSMTAEDVNKYASTFQKALQNNPDNKTLNTSIAICYLKLKLYDKALPAFEKAIEDNFDNSETYFYAAVCLLKGRKAFLAQREEIDKIEKYIGAAIMVEPRGIYYLLWAYIKYDYYERKFLRTSPNYKDMLNKAVECGCTQADSEMLFSILDVPCPDKIKLKENVDVAQSNTCVEKKSWWTIERIVIAAAAVLILIGSLLLIYGGGGESRKSSKSSYNIQSTTRTQNELAVINLVNWWNNSHNTKKADDCNKIYASQVKYYQQTYTPAQIAKTKRELFVKTPDFKQELSDWQITEIDQNTMKVHFNKKVWTSANGTPKNYPSYLVVKKQTTGWWIVEESDDVTDANLAKKKKK